MKTDRTIRTHHVSGVELIEMPERYEGADTPTLVEHLFRLCPLTPADERALQMHDEAEAIYALQP